MLENVGVMALKVGIDLCFEDRNQKRGQQALL